ncbi:restriction endonuclease S subunit [Sporomusa sp. KB1]|nr:restriction endonuclease S subunit [Sporomusa sp. KB1]
MITITSPRLVNIKVNKQSKTLTAKDNDILELSNSSLVSLNSLCEDEAVGSQIEVSSYCVFNTGSKLINISCMKGLLVDENYGESIPPQLVYGPTVVQKGDFLVSRNASLGKMSYVDEEIHAILNGGISKLRFRKYAQNYVPAFFISGYVTKYLEVITSKGGTQQNAKRGDLLEVKIPIPTKCNHEKPKLLYKYVSMLVQMLLDKERAVRDKNRAIDSAICLEIDKRGELHHKHPSIKDVKKLGNKRLDTNLSNYKFKLLYDKIASYENGYYFIDEENIGPGTTPDYRIYFDEPSEYNFLWITPSNISKRRLDYKTYIFTNETTRVLPNSVIISAVRHLGYSYYVQDSNVYCNQNTLIINNSKDRAEQLFLLCYLSSPIGIELQYAAQITGLVPIVYKTDFRHIPIPKFEADLKQSIVELYYNEAKRDLIEIKTYDDIDTVMANEKSRNSKLGIYQLNQEIVRIEALIKHGVECIIGNKKIEKLDLP